MRQAVPICDQVEKIRGALERIMTSEAQSDDGLEGAAAREEADSLSGHDAAADEITAENAIPVSVLKSCEASAEKVVEAELEVEVERALLVPPSKTQSLDADLRAVNQTLFPPAVELPPRPLPANECNFKHYFALDVGKELQDQYIYRHANGLCVVGLAPSHPALSSTTSIEQVDFNVGKQSRADMKVSGKNKKNGRALEANSVLCKVVAGDAFYLPRCCVRGVLLEVNERLIQNPSLLQTRASTEGHIAILMPRPEDWAKVEKTLCTREQYSILRGIRYYDHRSGSRNRGLGAEN